jgi:phosphatidylinositol alpha-mannosyltransferase
VLRIALVCPYSWSRPGGVREHARGLARALLARGMEVEIIAPHGRDGDVCVHDVGWTLPVRDNGSIVPVALAPDAAVRTAALVRRRGYDLVHVHEPMIPLVSLTAVVAAQAPVVGTFHMYAAARRWYRPFAPLARSVISRLAARVAVSELAAWHVRRVVPGDYRVIPNGVDVGSLAAVASERDGNRILYLGRAEPRKGLEVLLAAFSRLPGHAELDLVGVSARELGRLVRLPPPVRARIHAHGTLPTEERNRLLGRADVLCVPSLQGESFGIVLVEGMAAGVPVVASAVPGYRLVLPEEAGVLVPPGEPGALAGALRRLLDDPGLRAQLGRHGREAAWRYDWSRVASEIVAVYEDVLGAGPSLRADRERVVRRELEHADATVGWQLARPSAVAREERIWQAA